MTRRELVELLYQEPQPIKEITERVLNNIKTYLCKNELPMENGEYLIYHSVYGWCIYGYVAQHRWGDDDLVIRRDGTRYNKVVEWGKLDFLEKNET